ncbi:nuclease-related domain-containing protein [Neobacillus vireti]|uniref:nuclease-related domain-containing protein n=1 Tax=Neobacillus vireti TaxID=220686 RepID=UPI003000D86C
MIFKSRFERGEITLLKSLNARMDLTDEEKKNFMFLKKGFDGELMFDALTVKLQSDCLVLNDLLLEVGGGRFQIDTLIIHEKLYIFEVKNYEGNCYFESGNFYSSSGVVLKNALNQLNRCETLLRQLLQKHGFKFSTEGQVVFINPEFFLYQAPRHEPIVYTPQLNQLMKKLNSLPGKLNGKHLKLAELLVSLHITEDSYSRVRHYGFGQLRKGVLCPVCQSFMERSGLKILVCPSCRLEESVDAAVLRSVEELRFLFPEMRVTTRVVEEWCGGICSPKALGRILRLRYKAISYRRWVYFE